MFESQVLDHSDTSSFAAADAARAATPDPSASQAVEHTEEEEQKYVLPDLNLSPPPYFGDGDENARCSDEGTLPELITEVFHPKASAKNTSHFTSSPSALKDTQESTNSSSAGSRKNASPSLTEDVLTTSTEMPLRPKAEKALSDSSSDPDDRKSSRIPVQGVYVKSKMKTTFEEILKGNPNFLSALRVKTAVIKTVLVETAINCLETLRRGGITSEQLAYVRDSLDDLAVNGLDIAWLEKDYQRASIVLDEEKVVLWGAELARLEREKAEDEAAFQMAKEKLEASTALRDALKVKFDGLKQGLEARKKLLVVDLI